MRTWLLKPPQSLLVHKPLKRSGSPRTSPLALPNVHSVAAARWKIGKRLRPLSPAPLFSLSPMTVPLTAKFSSRVGSQALPWHGKPRGTLAIVNLPLEQRRRKAAASVSPKPAPSRPLPFVAA
jgi:hypothetical protein